MKEKRLPQTGQPLYISSCSAYLFQSLAVMKNDAFVGELDKAVLLEALEHLDRSLGGDAGEVSQLTA